jgi:hypothetical protein
VAAVTTLTIAEGSPTTWPDPALPLSDAAAAIVPEVVWRRIESWIAYRWAERPCTFIVEGGCGAWRPPLVPFTVATTEVWHAEAWEPVTLAPHPLGGVVIGSASHYRFAGTLGADDDPPEDVLEAYRRLAEYWAHGEDHPGASSYTDEIGSLRMIEERSPAWLARAMAYSGAADLLRQYRRAP